MELTTTEDINYFCCKIIKYAISTTDIIFHIKKNLVKNKRRNQIIKRTHLYRFNCKKNKTALPMDANYN